MNLVALPAFSDNYIWMLHDGEHALVVDPGDATPVRQHLAVQGLKLERILVTHHHPDHVDGLVELQIEWPAAETSRPVDARIPGTGVNRHDRESFVWRGVRIEVLAVPGHTRSHLAYFLTFPDDQAPVLFCGDTLFSAGCGRLFEGTPGQMAESLQALASLPPSTQICCAHEYTLSNLRFAQAVEPRSQDVARHWAQCVELRAAGQPTLPTTLRLERLINPFLRCDEPAVIESAKNHGATSADPVAVLAALREWKNHF